jgi:hypothetical protein
MATDGAVRFWTRRAHRWLGLLIGIQLLLWTVSGLYFSLIPIETVRGEDRVREAEPVNFSHTPLASPRLAIDALLAQAGPSTQVRSLQLRRVLGEPVYEIRYDLGGEHRALLADARDGSLLPPVARFRAIELAREDFAWDGPAVGTEYIERVDEDDEYRGGPLPAWRVSFADADSTRIYIDASLARVTARRNTTWRIFDFLWMLHIMDFEEREDFNTTLLQVFAGLGLITILSGFLLWGLTTSLFRRRS